MALSPLRKWLNIGFGLVLLSFVGALLWPLISRPFELRAFCSGLQLGMSYNTIRDLANQQGFKMSLQDAGIAHVYDHQSLGKFSCTLQMKSGALTRTSFSFAD